MAKTGKTTLQVVLIGLFSLASASLYGMVFSGLADALTGWADAAGVLPPLGHG